MRARVSLLACIAVSAIAMAVPASASAQQQEGLVNVNVSNNEVQVPIGIAANLCGVDVGVLVSNVLVAPVQCSADAAPFASAEPGGGGGGGGPQQNGLVNLNVSGNTIQVPVAVAANICGVGVGVLSQGLVIGPVTCDARSRPRAQA